MYTYIFIYIYIYRHTYMYICKHIHMCVCIYICIRLYTYRPISTIYVYVYNIHIHIIKYLCSYLYAGLEIGSVASPNVNHFWDICESLFKWYRKKTSFWTKFPFFRHILSI